RTTTWKVDISPALSWAGIMNESTVAASSATVGGFGGGGGGGVLPPWCKTLVMSAAPAAVEPMSAISFARESFEKNERKLMGGSCRSAREHGARPGTIRRNSTAHNGSTRKQE